MLEHLELAHRFAERLALARPLQGLLQGQLCGHVGHDRQAQALALEVGHDAGETGILRADQVLHRHLAVVEEQLSGIRGPPAHLFQLAANAKTRRALLHQQQADAAKALTAGAHRHRVVIGTHAAGDEGLAAIDAVVIAVAHSAGLEIGHVGATGGLGHRQRHDLLAGQHSRHHTFAHGGRSPFDDGWQADIQRTEPGHQAAGAAAHQFLAGRHLGEHVTLVTAAELLRVTDTENARRAGLEVQLTRKLLGLLPLVDIRQDFTLDETPDGITNQLVGLIEIRQRGGHAGTPVIILATLT